MNLLVVEENLPLASTLRGLAQVDLQNVILESTPDKERALDLVDRFRPDVVVLDLGRPNDAAASLCHALRQRSDAVIIAIAPGRAVQERLQAFEMGADDCLSYPFYPRELAARIKARLRLAATQPPVQPSRHQMSVGRVLIDLDQREVWVQDQPIQLSPLEFQLLAVLVANEDRVLSRESLARAVWRGNGPPVQQVKIYVYRLRKRLGGRASGVAIQNVRGMGYRLRRTASD